MKKTLLILASAAVAFAACNKVETVVTTPSGEMSVIPMNADASPTTKGYVEESKFVETYYNALQATDKTESQVLRTMQISSYLHPQNGEEKNYFVDKTYSPKNKDDLSETEWWNTNTVGGTHDPIYWPVGGTLDFLAYSVSAEETGAGKSQNVTAAWDETNAASKVVLTIPGENTQNDILFAGAAGIESSTGSTAVPMKFSHAQAWLEFVLKGNVDASNPDGIVTLKRIELEDVYNAGTLTVSNNRGNTFAKWDFSEEIKQDIEVDNFNTENKLNTTAKYLDMLIPQQTKTAFVIYYTLGNSPKELSYRFTTDQKTWLMGEKYIYSINITTSEVTVEPVVTEWNGPVQGFEYTVTYNAGDDKGKVTVSDIFGGTDNGDGTITCDTWGAQVTLTAEPEGDAVFVKWSDDVTENPRTFTITGSTDLPVAVFAKLVTITITTKSTELSRSRGTLPVTEAYIAGEPATIKVAPAADGYKFFKWCNDESCIDYMGEGENAIKGFTVNGDEITIPSVNTDMTFYAKYIPVDAIPGGFSVSASKKVFFSPGNLYATVTFGTGGQSAVAQSITGYAFESDQTYFRTWNNDVEADKYAEDKAYFGSETTTPANTVGLFYWTDHDVEAVSKIYKDDDAAASGNTFFAESLDVNDHTWSCLTNDEWTYLLNISGEESGARTDANRFAKAKVNGVNGILIFPDGYTRTHEGTGFGTINNADYEEFPTESIDGATWLSMQEAGVVFLPASGVRLESDVDLVGSNGHYWSTTPSAKNNAYYACFSKDCVDVSIEFRSLGGSVRLVSE